MDDNEFNGGGQAILEDGAIIIRVPIAILPMVIEGAWAARGLETRYKITNVEEFSADLIRELNKEDEDGTTRIHTMFDAAIDEAVNQGAFGIEIHENQEG